MDSSYQWLVKKGRLSLSIDQQFILLQAYPEGGDICILTPEDVDDIIGILSELARTLWEKSGHQSGPLRTMQEIIDADLSWPTPQDTLTLIPSPETNDLKFKVSGRRECQLSMEQSIELAQVLEQLIS